MSRIKFGELPPDGRSSGMWAGIAAQLKEKPGQWALARTLPTKSGASSNAASIRGGVYSAMPAGQFEAHSRGCDVWARYVGDDQ